MLGILLGLWLALVAPPQETGAIEGTVRRGGTSDPISGVQLSLLAPNVLERVRTISDAQGRFSFESVPFGRYTIQVARDAYFTYPAGQPLPYPVTSVEVGRQRNQIFIDLMPGAAISGRVTDAEGRPLPGVRVSAMDLQYRNGNPAFGVGSVPERAGQGGEFRLSWFAPGEYYVRAEVVAGQNDLARKSYYPGTLDPNVAVPLVIRGGESIENLNFVVPEAPPTTISGVVIADAPVTGVMRTFYLLPLDGRPSEVYPLEFTNLAAEPPQGQSVSFKLDVRGVAPGFYDLAPFYMDRQNVYHSGRTRIEIGSQNTENLTAFITPNADVLGRLIIEDNNASQVPSGVQFHLRPEDAAVPLMTRTSPATVAADGTFVIKDVFEGRYQLHMTVLPRTFSDLYIAAIRQGAQDLRNDGIIDVRQSMLPLEIRFRSGAGIVQGVVEGTGGALPAHAAVVLVPNVPMRENVLFYDRTTSTETGQFKFERVAPGEYKVFAFERLPDTAEQNSRFISRYETLGKPVTVNSRAATEVRVPLVRQQ